MHVDRAIAQLSEIHAQVLRSEIFRGYRARPVFATGVLAFAVGAIQTWAVPWLDLREQLLVWVGFAALCAAICGGDLGLRCMLGGDQLRHQTFVAVRQFVPAIVAGSALTIALLNTSAAALLPGLWTLVFGLGVFASVPFLPREIAWVALFYLAAGGSMVWHAAATEVHHPWYLATVMGIGQTTIAWLLRTRLETPRG